MAGINVKVATKKLIAALEAKVSANKKRIAEYEKAKEAHDKLIAKWEIDVVKTAPKVAVASGEKPSVNVSNGLSWRHPGKVQVEITYFLPEKDAAHLLPPKFDHGTIHGSDINTMNSQNSEMENAVRILNLSDEEYVSTTTYKSVSKYL